MTTLPRYRIRLTEPAQIFWTKDMLVRFRAQYKAAMDQGLDAFVFENHDFVVGYAKYLIEFLEGRVK